MGFEAKSVSRVPIPPEAVVRLQDVRLREEDFSARKLIQFSATGSRFEACRFDGAHISSASFGSGKTTSEYVECSFDGAQIHFGPGGYARFLGCTFRNADLRNWFSFAVELVQCEFSGRIHTAVFNGTVPQRHRTNARRERNEFHDNDFSGAELIDVSFRTGIDLSSQRLPSGAGYLFVSDAKTAVEQAHREVVGWQDGELRRQAMGLMRTLQRTVQGGQQQLLLRQADFTASSGISSGAARAVFELLSDSRP